MRIIVGEGFTSFNLPITRNIPDFRQLSRFLASLPAFLPEDRLSDRKFESAIMVCAEIELGHGEIIVCDEVKSMAEQNGWYVADFWELSSFCINTINGFPNLIPRSLLSTFFSENGVQNALQLTRTSWDHQARFNLSFCIPERLHGEQHVLLVRELALE